jgi:hypothetical protein
MVEASAVDPGPPRRGLRGTVAAAAASVAAPFTKFLLLTCDFSVVEVVGSFFPFFMSLLPYIFEQLRWASASDLIARAEEHSDDVGTSEANAFLISQTKSHESEQRSAPF